jgi:hypothetical protein
MERAVIPDAEAVKGSSGDLRKRKAIQVVIIWSMRRNGVSERKKQIS